MSQGLRRAVWLLGACQCALWGVLYYGFSIWIEPLVLSLNAPRVYVAAAFSMGLGLMALAAPWVGRQLDRGRGVLVIRIGFLLAALGLICLACTHSLLTLFLAWVLLGLSMSALLYETAFGLVTRAVTEPSQRLRALSTITVLGGLASTVFLPLLALLAERYGWRQTTLGSIALLLLVAVLLERYVLPALPQQEQPTANRAPSPAVRPAIGGFALVFVTSTLASICLVMLLIPRLRESGVSATWAASALGIFGLAQLPGRLWLSARDQHIPSRWLGTVPMICQAAGLALLALSGDLYLAFAAVALFGLGSGLMTLARPWLVQLHFGRDLAGQINGRIAGQQGLARAAGPVAAVGLAQFSSTAWVFAVLATLMLALTPVARRLAKPSVS